MPPEVARVTADPVGPDGVAVLTVSVACLLRKLKVFAEELIAAYVLSAALVAVTTQSVGTPTDEVTVVVPDAVAMVQRAFGVERAYVTAPVPVPPETLSATLSPMMKLEDVLFEILSVAWSCFERTKFPVSVYSPTLA